MRSVRIILTIVCLLAAATAQAADDWAQILSDPQPSARYWHAMAWSGEDKVLLQGGTDGFDETWIYDPGNSTWSLLDAPVHPQSLFWHSLVHIGDDQVLLFGGADGGYHDETWVFDLSDSAWTEQNPASSPSARWIHDGIAYLGEDRALLFGGQDGGGYCGDTWVYDLSDNSWAQLIPPDGPTARWGHAMASIGENRVVLFGGYDAGGRDDETWLFDLGENTWTQQDPAVKPSARYEHAMAYIGDDQVLLFGGQTDSGYDDETWVYDLSEDNWTLDSNAVQPSARSRYGLSETSIDGSTPLVMFGGCNVTALGETWLFGGGDYLSLPSAISDLKADLAGEAIRLSWSEITENTGGNPLTVDHYTIYRSDDPGFTPGPGDSVAGTADTVYVDLSAAVKDTSTNHSYVVKAVDSAGRKSSESNRVGEFDRQVMVKP